LQVGVPPTYRIIVQAKAVALIPANQEERLIEDVPLAVCPSWT
jgi:hypothetical protein